MDGRVAMTKQTTCNYPQKRTRACAGGEPSSNVLDCGWWVGGGKDVSKPIIVKRIPLSGMCFFSSLPIPRMGKTTHHRPTHGPRHAHRMTLNKWCQPTVEKGEGWARVI